MVDVRSSVLAWIGGCENDDSVDRVHRVMRDVASEVARLTDLSVPLSSISVRVVRSLGRASATMALRFNRSTSDFTDRAMRACLPFVHALALRRIGIAALYDPYDHAIYVAHSLLLRLDDAGLRVAIGHELVHAAQFHAYPELLARHEALHRALVAADEIPVGLI